jgi:two-component system chemotaxis response regulator CheB
MSPPCLDDWAEAERCRSARSLPDMIAGDLIVIGASAGGVGALLRLAPELPRDWSAAVAIVIHVPPRSTSNLPAILGREARLSASFARHDESIEAGRIYVAPPDHHLVVADGVFRLSAGPQENRYRPAIDVLFRSAARSWGARCIGVVLSGHLDDGTIGLVAIRRAGGIAVVQDPADAECPSMPRSALENAGADHCVPLAELGSLLQQLVLQNRRRPPMGAKEPGTQGPTPAERDAAPPAERSSPPGRRARARRTIAHRS